MDVKTDRLHRGTGKWKKAMNFSNLRCIAFLGVYYRKSLAKQGDNGNVDDPIYKLLCFN